MLVLTINNSKEFVQIGPDIKVYAARSFYRGKEVISVSIDAPSEIPIVRSTAVCRTKKVQGAKHESEIIR